MHCIKMNRPKGIKSAHSRAKGDMWYDTDSEKMMYSLGQVTEADIKQDWRRVFDDAPYNAHWVDDEVFSAATGVTLGNTVLRHKDTQPGQPAKIESDTFTGHAIGEGTYFTLESFKDDAFILFRFPDPSQLEDGKSITIGFLSN